MDQEILVKGPLTKEMIREGEKFVRYVDELSDLDVHAYFWMHDIEADDWYLVVASPEVQTKGPGEVYKKLQTVFAKIPKGQTIMTLEDVTVIGTYRRVVKALKKTFKKYQKGIRLKKYGLNGYFMEDGYLYEIKKKR